MYCFGSGRSPSGIEKAPERTPDEARPPADIRPHPPPGAAAPAEGGRDPGGFAGMSAQLTGFLASWILLGLSAGLSPGPILTLVITETLKYSPREGIKVAVSPLITDAPIVAAAAFGLSQLSDHTAVVGVIYLLGGGFLAYLGIDSLRFKGADLLPLEAAPPRSLRRGIIANFLNPSPYLFWLSIGAPLVVAAWRTSPAAAAAFLIVFYLLLVGSKVLIALAVGKSRRFLRSRGYILVIRCLGAALLIFAAFFFRNAAIHLGFA
jgi:threonine/homoserine/homoserine lactone efflux protein